MAYVDDYFASKYGTIYRPSVDYTIADEDSLAEHWQEFVEELQTLKPIREYSPQLQALAKQYLPQFIAESPGYADEDCLKWEK